MTEGDARLGFATGRWDAVDAARGVAIAAMIVYHFGWDLSFLQLWPVEVVENPAWQIFARTIAGSFLFLVGLGLVLAHGKEVRRQAFLRRLAVIAGAAALVTVATYFIFPDSFIFFGILHCIALSSVLALPFLRAPLWLVVVCALLTAFFPWFATSPSLDGLALDWLGLGAREPRANDYVPIFPWFACVLAGVVFGRTAMPWLTRCQERRWQAGSLLSRTVIRAGRRSLPIYLLHQPLLLGVLVPLSMLTGPNPAALRAGFERECQATCRASGTEDAICVPGCACVADWLKSENLMATAMREGLDEAQSRRASEVGQQCVARLPTNQTNRP